MKKIKVRVIELAKPDLDLVIVDNDDVITWQWVAHDPTPLTVVE